MWMGGSDEKFGWFGHSDGREFYHSAMLQAYIYLQATNYIAQRQASLMVG